MAKHEPETGQTLTFPWQGLIIAFALALFFDWQSYFANQGLAQAIAYAHGALLLLLAASNLRLAMNAFVFSAVLVDDISRFSFSQAASPDRLINIATVSIQGITLINYIALGLFLAALTQAARENMHGTKTPKLFAPDWCVAGVAAVYAISALHGYHNLLNHFRVALNHLNMPIMLCLFYAAIRLHYRRTEQIAPLWNCLLLPIAAKAILWTIFALLGIGTMFGTTIRVGFGITLLLFVLLLAYALTLQNRRINMPPLDAYLVIIAAVAGAEILLITAGRMSWIFASFAILVVLVLAWRALNSKRIAAMLVCLAVLNLAVMQVAPKMFTTMGSMAGSLNFLDPNQITGSHSTLIRVYEFKNIHAELKQERNLILGKGPGGHFTDRIHPFPIHLRDADYSKTQIATRQFTKPHGLLQRLILTLGYGGMAIFTICMAGMYFSCFYAFRAAPNALSKSIALALLAFLPAIVYMTWSAKATMICGLCMGIVGAAYRIARPTHD